ncbi:MAG TPA: hypothetical protein VMT19_02285 [Thermoanaerobaculaceae bacterium]|nr:hypothetical protein [Thermoanaerobaculaceae bacterium]
MGATFSERLLGALDVFFEGVMRFLPGLLAGLLIITVGVLAGWVVKAVARRALVVARFDRFCESAGLTTILSRADVRATPSALVASLLFWLILASSLMAGASALRVDVINRLIAESFLYLPRVLSALGILLVGFLLANFLSRAALLSAVNAHVPSPRIIGLVVKFLIAVLAFAMALEQLEIAKSIVLAAFIIAFGAVMLGLAIAFGFGGRDVARRVLERQFGDRGGEDDDDTFRHV